MTSPARQAHYRYIFGNLRTEQIIEEIPLFGTYIDFELNVGGRFDGTFNLDQTGKRNEDLIAATIPGRCFVIVERNGIPIWGGFVWSRVYQSQSKTVQLYAQHFQQYPQYQLIRSNFVRSFNEQQKILMDLWTDMQSVSGRNINVNVPKETPPDSITYKTVNIKATDFKFYSEVMSSIADATDGFDWTIDITKSDNFYIKTLRTGYPTLGNPDPSRMIFEYPGSILNYYATESMAGSGTNVFTIGSGEGDTMLIYENVQDSMITLGFPRWDAVVSRKDIDNSFILNSVGQQEGAIRKPPKLILKPSLKGDIIPEFGSFGLGDACTVVIKDPRFPNTLNFQTRIVKWTLTPQSSANTDEFTLIFAGDEDE